MIPEVLKSDEHCGALGPDGVPGGKDLAAMADGDFGGMSVWGDDAGCEAGDGGEGAGIGGDDGSNGTREGLTGV